MIISDEKMFGVTKHYSRFSYVSNVLLYKNKRRKTPKINFLKKFSKKC